MKWYQQWLLPSLAAVCLAGNVQAAGTSDYPNVAWTLLQVSLVPDQLAVVSADTPVIGVNLEPFWGAQKRVDGLNLQPLFGFSDEINGISVQGFGETTRFAGLQFGLVAFATHFQGVSFSLVTGVWENRGLQVGVANFSGNTAPVTYQGDSIPPGGGLQLGLFNNATSGVQIGLLNYNANSPVPWMILFNASAR